MIGRLRKLLGVRPGEALPVLLIFLYIASVVASFILAKTIRNGLFLSQFGAYKLVYVYVGVPLVLSVFVPIYTSIVARVGLRAVITGSLGFFFMNALAFWLLFRYSPFPALSAVFYIWVNCYGIIAPVQVWTLANSVFDTRQAKRLFGVIGSGASFGAIAGGLLARTLVAPLGGAANLILVLAALIACAVAAVTLLRSAIPQPAPAPSEAPRLARNLAVIARTPYLREIAAAVFLVAIVTQWTGFQILLVAQERHAGDADRLTAFLGELNVYFAVVAILVQVLLTGPALRRFGVALAILLLPTALGLGSALVLLFPALWSVLLTNGFDQSLRFSIDKATFELLYLPISPSIKADAKATIDMFVNRLADAVGGLLLGLATKGFSLVWLALPGVGLGLRGTAGVTFLMTLAWIAVALALRRRYVDAIRESIQEQRVDPRRSSPPVLDRLTIEILAGKLRSDDTDELLYALSLFEMQRAHATHPALRALLHHASAAVRRRALSILSAAGDRSVLPEVEQMLQDDDLETRTEALAYLARHAHLDPLDRIRELGDFHDVSVRAAMVAFLARPGETQNLEAARAIIEAMLGEPGPEGGRARLEVARLMASLPDEFGTQLGRLLQDRDVEVARLAIRAVGRLQKRELVREVVDLLAHPQLGAEAAQALAGIGERIVGTLRDRLFDPAVPVEVRREIPGVLARIGTPFAQAVLMESLLESDPTLRFRIVASLNKLRQTDAEVGIDTRVVETVLAAEIIGHYRSYQILGSLGQALQGDDPAVRALKQSMDQEVERIFHLMALLYPHLDLHSAYRGLISADASVRANALELVDNILKPSLRQLVVPLLDGHVSVEQRVVLANRLVGTPVETAEQAVQALVASGDHWLKACAAHAIGAVRLTSLEGELDKWLDDLDPLLRETARSAKRRLAEPPAPAGEPEPPSPVRGWETSDRMGVG